MSEETDGEMLKRLGIDGDLWAKEFITIICDKNPVIDVALMRAWFANSIMAGYDEGRRRERIAQKELYGKILVKIAAKFGVRETLLAIGPFNEVDEE